MNSYKLNSTIAHLARHAICKYLNIPLTQIYKEVKSMDLNGTITTQDGKKYQLTLKQIN